LIRFGCLLSLTLLGCAAHAPLAPPSPPKSPYLAKLTSDARAMDHEVSSPFAHRFLAEAAHLPSKGAAADEDYYEADVSAPLHFVLPIEVLSARGFEWRAGTRILDFGYGSIGHLAMLAGAGVDASGIEVRPKLETLYAGEHTPHLHLFMGRYPAEPALVAKVGGGYDAIVSKNVLKKGYIHPDRPAEEKHLIKLGVDDATFLRAFHDALTPGGRVVIYNIFVPIPPDQPFKPMSDGRCPFTREQWESAGFTVEAFDQSDTVPMRKLLASAAAPNEKEYRTYESLFTVARRRE
jgi:hypothetical protein